MRYALCPAEGPPFLWDPAPPAKRISSPWIADNVAAPISNMQGALPPKVVPAQSDFAKQIKKSWRITGSPEPPAGHRPAGAADAARPGEPEGIEVVDGQQAMLDAREVKTARRDRAPESRRRHGGRHLLRHLQGDPAGRAAKASWWRLLMIVCFGSARSGSSASIRWPGRAARRIRTPSRIASSSRAT